MAEIILTPLAPDDREQFISDNQEAFNYGALEESGRRDELFEEEGEIISREPFSNLSKKGKLIGSCRMDNLLAAWSSGSKVIRETLNSSLFPQKFTAGESVIPRGAKSKNCTRK